MDVLTGGVAETPPNGESTMVAGRRPRRPHYERWLLALLALGGLAALGGGLRPVSAAPIPVVMTTVCVAGGQGQLSFPLGGTCAPGTPSFRVDDPAQILTTCYLNSNGGIRKVSSATQCTSAPRSKKETFLPVPSLTNDLYFCAENVGGWLYFKGTSAATCPSGQFPVVVKQANHPPVSNSQSVSVNEDSSVLVTLSASDTDDQNLTFSIVAGQAPTHGTLGAIGAPNCAAVNTCTATVTYTPSPNYFGSDSFKFRTYDGFASSADATVTINVAAVNDVPGFTKGADLTVDEDAGVQSVSGWATAISPGPTNESGQTVSFNITGNTNAGLFSAGPAVSSTGTLTFTPAANANGMATITLTISDNGGTANGGVDTSASQSFTITVAAVNDPPSFTKGSNQTVLEDAGAQSVIGWATAISPGPADESTQNVSFNITGNTNPGLFSAGPAISASGTLSYTPAANQNGVATITIKAADDGTPPAESATQIFTITITPVNDAPGFDLRANPDQSVPKDSPVQTVAGFATNISPGPVNESGQVLTFNVSNGNSILFSAQPDIDEATGDLTYTPAAGATGTATVSVYLTDNGGTANGGVDTSATKTFDIVVFPPNATPVAQSQTGVGGVAAPEDTLTTITLTATDADDDNLTFSIVTGPSNGLLGAISGTDCTAFNICTATVDYTPGLNYNGVDSFTFKANDGIIDSSAATVEINVAAVNDAPSFTKGSNQTVFEDAGAQSVIGWATAIIPGPADESGQSVSFNITGNTNPGLFSAGPAVSSSGTLTYTPAANANGSAAITLTLQDDAGTATGGVDTSAAQTFTINVTAVNDVPSFTKGADQTVFEDSGAQSVASWSTAISKGPANEAGQTVTFNVTDNTNPGLFSAGPAVSSTGTLTFTPAANQNGTATITLTLQDDGGTANGGVDTSAPQTFDITISAVNDKPVAENKPTGGAIAVQANMKRVGINASLLTGVTDADSGVSGCSPTFSVVSITSGSGGTVSNVNLGAGTFDFDPAPGFTGAATVNYTVADDGCPGVATSDPSTISLTVSGPVIWFVNPAVAGPGTGTLADPFKTLAAADAVDATNHRVFVYAGATTTGLTLNSGEWLIGQAATGSFDTFFSITPPSGTIARPTMGFGPATIGGTVTLATNAKVQGVAISTGTAAGVVGSGGISGFTVSESSIVTTTGTAVSLNNASIGAGGLTFSSISSNGATNGIILNNTGTTGGLTVTGTGGTCTNANTIGCTGGEIRSSSGSDDSSATPVGTGIVLNNTMAPSFTRMWIHDHSNYAIRGTNVASFTLANSVVNGTNGTNGATPFNDASVAFTNLTGSVAVGNSDIRGGFYDNFRVLNSSGSLDRITFSSVTFGLNGVSGNDSLLFESSGSATMKATVQNSTFLGAPGDLVNFIHNGTGPGDLVLSGNSFSNSHTAIATGGGGLTLVNDGLSGATTMSITNNTFRDAVGPGVLIVKQTGASTQTGTFTGNTIGVSGVPNSGSAEGSALKLQTVGQGTLSWTVTNNSIFGYNNFGVEVLAGGSATLQSGAVNTTITGNTIAQPGNTAGTLTVSKNGIHLNIGTVPGDTYQACAVIGGAGALGNSIATAGLDAIPPTVGDVDFRLRQRQATTIRLPGYAGAITDNAAVQAFVASNNAGNGASVALASNTAPTGGGFTGAGVSCP